MVEIRILIVHGAGPRKYPSGEISVIERESEYLQYKGHLVNTVIDNGGLGWNPFRLFWFPKKNRILKEAILSFQPDIVHFHSVIPYLGLSILALPRRYGVTVVQTLHNGRWICVEGGYIKKDKYCDQCVGSTGWKGVVNGCGRGYLVAIILFLINLYARITRKLFLWVNNFIAVSEYVRQQHKLSGFPDEKILVNNNGIDLKEFDGKSCPWNARNGIAFAGRISVAKGAKVLKTIFQFIKCPIHIIGDGPDLDELKQYCQSNAHSHVVFWGKQDRDQVLKILGSVICTVVPSQCGDSFPTVAVESMALGTPVVASDLGGLPDLVGTWGGKVVEHDKTDQFISSITDFLCNREQAELSGKNARKYVQEHISIEVTGKRLLSIYEELLIKK